MKKQVFKALTLSFAISSLMLINTSLAQTMQTTTQNAPEKQIPQTKHSLLLENQQIKAENTQLHQQVEQLRFQLDSLRQELSAEKTKKYQDCLKQSGFKIPQGPGLQTPTLTVPLQGPTTQMPIR